MTGSRSRTVRCGVTVLLALGLLVAMGQWIAGCSSDVSNPTFPTAPDAEAQLWFFSIWGGGPGDFYVVGQPGVILHFDTDTWSREESSTTEPLIDVWSPDGTTYYACGHNGTLLRNTGGGWNAMASGTEENLFSIGRYYGELHVCGQRGEIRRLSESDTWVAVADSVVSRDNNGVAVDTLVRQEDIASLVAVSNFGIGGGDRIVLMQDSGEEWPWEQRLIESDLDDWVLAAWNSDEIASNFFTTKAGNLLQLDESDDGLAWRRRFSPADSAVYGIWVQGGGTFHEVFCATQNGQVVHETIEMIPGVVQPRVTHEVIYDGPIWLSDVWGASTREVYAVGVNGNVVRLRYFDPEGGQHPSWQADVIELPADLGLSPNTTKSAGPLVDKFGYPVN